MRACAFVIVFALCVLATQGKTKNCTITLKDSKKTVHPLLLKPNSTEFLYPINGKIIVPAGEIGARIACPGGNIVLKKKSANRTIGDLECVSGKFRFAGDNVTALFQIKELSCNGSVEAIAQTVTPTKLGFARATIGFPIDNGNATEFVSAIDELVNGETDNRTVTWAQVRVPQAIAKREKSKVKTPTYRNGTFNAGIVIEDVYIKENQRSSFLDIFNDTSLVDKYMPVNSTDFYFSQGKLISSEDLYYEIEQNGSYIYDNVVPIWETINNVNGNWELIGQLVRTYASQSKSGLDVWSGGLQQLDMAAGNETRKSISLTHGIKPPQYLFKYVHDESANSGLVFITLNNPHAEHLETSDLLCDGYSSCVIMYPEFVNATRGLTYCCKLDAFDAQANAIGLPTFPGAAPLF